MNKHSVKDYIEGGLRKAIASKAALRRKVNAHVVFTVVGEEQGVWTFDLRAEGKGDLVQERVKDPDLHITMMDDFVPEFFSGRTDLKRAMDEGRWGFRGKPRVGQAFADLLRGGISPLSARMGMGLSL